METQALTQAFSAAGRRGGRSRSDAKIAAARANGRLGGRPRKKRDRRGRIMRLLGSSANDSWETPQGFFEELDAEFQFTLDAAAAPSNAKCPRYFTEEDDALRQKWSGRVFCNPPYGGMMTPAFIRKAYAERNNCEVIVALVPARTSTKWWRDYIWSHEGPHAGVTVRFPPRLKNTNRNHPSKSERRWPFPSVVIIFRPDYAL